MNATSHDRHSAVDFAGATRMHVALYTTDIPRAIDFYRTLFAVDPVKVRDDYAKFEVAEPSVNLSLNLVPSRASKGGRLSHLGIQVKSTGAVASAIARLGAAGFSLDVEEGTTCCYAVQDKVWASDPDGNRWEVFVVLDADAPVHSADRPVAASCCTPERASDEATLVHVTAAATEACCAPECCSEGSA